MNALRPPLNARAAQLHVRSATQSCSLPVGQRCVRMTPQARVKEQEEFGLVLSAVEQDYYREVCTHSKACHSFKLCMKDLQV